MTLCDVHAHIGHWPFRRLQFSDAGSLLKEMDRTGIQRALVCNTHSVFYKNAHAGNEELAAAVRRHRDRLVPAATLNPFYVRAREDLRQCRQEYGCAALRLVPQYHGYELLDPAAVAFARQAAEQGMVIMVPRLMVDPRQKHPLDVSRTIGLEELFTFAGAVGEGIVVGLEFGVPSDRATVRRILKTPNLLFGITRIPYLNHRRLPELLDAVGAERFLFATGRPFKVAEPAILKVANIADRRERELVGHGNFDRLFGGA